MSYFNNQDILVRSQLISSKIGELGTDYTNKLKLGIRCINDCKTDILILSSVLELLSCYKTTLTDNCYTEDDLITLLDNISDKYDITFQPPGFEYN